MDGAALVEHTLLEKRTRPARLQHRRPEHSRERNADHTHHHWRRTSYHGFLPRAFQRGSARNGHRISHRSRRQSAGADHYDRNPHQGRIGAGALGIGACGEKDGNYWITAAVVMTLLRRSLLLWHPGFVAMDCFAWGKVQPSDFMGPGAQWKR